ncbi:MAG: glycerol kinase GlpK [Crocinitomicaceae bacterium]|jgi:glycerol kinase|nr:glycerol kinase GlpK [Crocinitomicaceae bacterium]
MNQYILSIDAGTTSSRALIFDKKGNEIAKAQFEFKQHFPKEGWVEHDPLEIWSSQKKALQSAMSMHQISSLEIKGIGITNQRETTVVWEKDTGKPIYNAIVWQDRRTSEYCNELKEKGMEPLIMSKTGLLLDPYFSGTKIHWILENIEGARKKAQDGQLLFGTIDTWLIWNLTGGEKHITDPSNASRTLLYDIHKNKWDEELLKLFNIPFDMLPRVVQSVSNDAKAKLEDWESSIPICAIAGDQQAALFGQLCFTPGAVKNTYGTGCFSMMHTGQKAVKSKNKMLTTIAWQMNDEVEYALEGSVFIGGALIQWLRDGLDLVKDAAEIEHLALSVSDNGGVTFISALTGLGAPYWDPFAKGGILGLTRGTEKGHIARAALEAIAIRSMEIIVEMEKDSGIKFSTLKVDGGASRNNLLMQIQANLLNAKVIRPKITETTALGIAFMAGLGCGYWKDKASLKDLCEEEKSFTPQYSKSTNEMLKLWNHRIQKILSNESR